MNCFLVSAFGFFAVGAVEARILTVAVLIDSSNPDGYNTNPSNPGEFQRYPERYLEHLQVPYEIFNVSAQGPPADLAERQLVLVAHRGVSLSTAWRNAIASAVFAGSGLVNLDWSPNIGTVSHIQQIFGSSGSFVGNPGATVTVPQSVTPGGANAHFIAGLQRKFLGDPAGDFVYDFHPDENGFVQQSAATVLSGVSGSVIAYLGSAPLITATSYGQGRAVHFGTLDYLKADRFGFLMGVDDLFWRSLVWAARKPFVVRGYPRLWTVQMDDQLLNWAFRISDMYDTTLTGQTSADGIGGPWKPTGYIMPDWMPNEERNAVITDIEAGLVEISPHSFGHIDYGDLYWNGSNGELTDSQWLVNLAEIQAWKQGSGSAQPIPSFSRSMVGHFWDISDNIGYDAWNTLGFRYITAILRPGFQNPWFDPSLYGGAERLSARPFWIYERPPKITQDEDYPFFFADDLVVNSRAGFPSRTFYLFTTQFHDNSLYSRPDISWPNAYASNNLNVAGSVDMHTRSTWRFWSSLAPFQVYTHDGSNYANSSTQDRRQVIQQVSGWLNQNGARHVFMDDLGDYIYARNKSMLETVTSGNGLLTYTFSGSTATADGTPVNTQVLVFPDQQSEGSFVTIPPFSGGTTLTIPVIPTPPAVSGVSPTQGPTGGGTQITISGSAFLVNGQLNITGVLVGSNPATAVTVVNAATIIATTPAGSTGLVDVAVLSDAGTAVLPNSFTYLGAPAISSLSPNIGPEGGGTAVTISGQGFEPGSTVRFAGTPATSVTYVGATRLDVVTPAGTPGLADVTVSNAVGSTAAPGAFQYIASGSLLFSDNFDDGTSDGWNISPLGGAAGWSVVNGAYRFDGSGHTQSYSGDAAWSDYTLDVKFRLTTLNNYPGGIRGRVDPVTGESYAVWFYPSIGEMVLWKATAWYIDNPGLTQLGVASGLTFDTTQFHLVRLVFNGDQITVYYDGSPIITATDASYASGLIALDVESQPIDFDDIVVTFGSTAPPELTAISATPASIAFGQFLETAQLQVAGQFSDGSTTDLTADPGTSYQSGNPAIADVDGGGLVMAFQDGSTAVTIGYGTFTAVVPVTVNLTPTAPQITGVNPSFGSASGGTAIEITGSGFTATTTVSIGGIAASGVVYNNPGSLSAVTPVGSVGPATVTVTNGVGSASLVGGFLYVAAGSLLFADDFNDGVADGWTVSPLGAAGGWSVVGNAYTFNGSGHTQSYAGDPTWTDYTFDVKFKLATLNNYPGGIRARVNPATGESYAVWLYPANRSVTLWKVSAWSVDSPGLSALGTATNINFDTTTFHQLRMVVGGNQIDVYLDGSLLISVTDTTYASGLIALDVSNQTVQFDDVVVNFGAPGQPTGPQLTGLQVTPASVGLSQAGQTQQLAVTGLYSDGSSQVLTADPGTSFISGNPGVVTASAAGLLTAVANGNTAVTVANGTISVQVPVSVAITPAPPQLTGLQVTPASVGLSQAGQTQQLAVTGLYSDGSSQVLTAGSGTSYISGNPGVVTANAAGLLTAVANGNTAVTVANGTISVQVPVGVAITPAPPQLTGLQVTPASVSLSQTGQTQQLAVTGLYSDGSSQVLTAGPGTSYTSGNPGVASVGGSGLVTAVANGNTAVTVANGTVSVAVPVSVTITPTPPQITGINPSTGPVGGGTAVVITGTNFLAGSTVTIGGIPATSVIVANTTTINAVTPAGTAGAANVVVTTSAGSATLAGGFTYATGGSSLFNETFSDGNAAGWTISPLGNAGGWSVVSGVYRFNGSGHTQSYAGDAAWQNYTVDVDFQLNSLNNYPGGIRGRVDPATGTGYAVWLYPANGQIILWRVTNWNVDSPGLTQLAGAAGLNFGVGVFHTVTMSFTNNLIEVYFDGQLQFSVTDSTYSTGLIALDVSNQPIGFDNISVVMGP